MMWTAVKQALRGLKGNRESYIIKAFKGPPPLSPLTLLADLLTFLILHARFIFLVHFLAMSLRNKVYFFVECLYLKVHKVK